MKIPYFCCIGAELKRYAKDFDFMNQVYLYKVPVEDTIEDVFAQDYFKAVSSTVLQDDILYVYETAEQTLHVCRFDKANGHITAVKLESNIPELEPDRILVSDHNGKIAAGDLSLEYIKDTLSILHCTATLSSTVDTTTVVMLSELEAFANLDSRPSYKATGALVIDGNGNRGIIESVNTTNKTAVIVTTFAYNAVVKDSAETQVMQGGLQTPELETDSLIVNGAATFEEAPITNDTTTYQSAANDSLVRKEQVEEVVQDIKTSSLTFIGYVSTTAPDSNVYKLNKKDLWLNSATMPTSFPFAQANIKEWDGTAWVAHSQDYTPANFDFFRNINDSEGYYWFAGQWVVMSTDMSTTYFQLNTISGKWEIKSDVNLPGAPTTTTPSASDSSTRIATTKFVKDSFAPLASPAFTGTPTTPTLTDSSPNDQIANKEYVDNATANSGSGLNIGDRFITTRLDNELNGAVECNGATYNASDVNDGENNIIQLLTDGKLDYISLTAYATAISTKGWCDKIGWDGTGTTSFRVPTISPRHYIVKTQEPTAQNNYTWYRLYADSWVEQGGYVSSSGSNTITLPIEMQNSNYYINAHAVSSSHASSTAEATKNTVQNKVRIIAQQSTTSFYCVGVGDTELNQIGTYWQVSGMSTITPESASRVMIHLFNGATDEAVATCTSVLADVAGLKDLSNITATGKETIAHNAMPSNRYVGLTLGASGTSYTAPADGYVSIVGSASGSGCYVVLGNKGMYATGREPSTGFGVRAWLPVSKGDSFLVEYNQYSNTMFRFIYANGAQ